MKRIVTFALSFFVLAACSSTVDRSLLEQRELLTQARLTVMKMIDSEEFPQLRGYMQNARAILVVPDFYKAGFIVGGEFGNAVLIARTDAVGAAPVSSGSQPEQLTPIMQPAQPSPPIESEPLQPQTNLWVLKGAYGLMMNNAPRGQWGNPVFYTMTGASVGLQIGGQSQEAIFTIMTQKGLNALLNRSVKLGADLSVAVGPIGKGLEAATALDRQADMYAFSKVAGLYGGGALKGSALREKAAWNMALYGNQAVPKQILLMTSSNMDEIESLRRILP